MPGNYPAGVTTADLPSTDPEPATCDRCGARFTEADLEAYPEGTECPSCHDYTEATRAEEPTP